MRLVRRFFPTRWPYVWRQGLANLYRPANQTVMVVLALGFGAFLLHTVLLVQHNLLGELQVDSNPRRPNLALFDIQPDQKGPVADALRREGLAAGEMVPIVPMRIQSVKGTPVESILGAPVKTEEPGRSPRWAFRREYRSTYRDSLTSSEAVIAGAAWAPGAGRGGAPVPISVEEGLARELKVGVGDEIVWDVQGVAVPSRVAALREVEWARFEPNFFVVFAAGPLDRAPQTFATLARQEDPARRALLQRRIVESFPNVTAVDLSQIQEALEAMVSRVALAIRFMALFSLATGLVVLLGAVASSRQQRVREGVLLKALGATRHQVLRVLLAEYLSLGTLSAVAGLALAAVAAWALLRFVFEAPFAMPVLPVDGPQRGGRVPHGRGGRVVGTGSLRAAAAGEPSRGMRRRRGGVYRAALAAAVCVACSRTNHWDIRNAQPRGSRIIAFGDSVTAGHRLKAGEAYPERLAALIGKPVLNRGVSGETTAEALDRLERDVLAADPRIVIVCLGVNDMLRGLPPGPQFAALRRIVEGIQERGALVVLVGTEGYTPVHAVRLRGGLPAPGRGDRRLLRPRRDARRAGRAGAHAGRHPPQREGGRGHRAAPVGRGRGGAVTVRGSAAYTGGMVRTRTLGAGVGLVLLLAAPARADRTQVYSIQGADCATCAEDIKKELKKVKGVGKVEFDKQKVEITVAPGGRGHGRGGPGRGGARRARPQGAWWVRARGPTWRSPTTRPARTSRPSRRTAPRWGPWTSCGCRTSTRCSTSSPSGAGPAGWWTSSCGR